MDLGFNPQYSRLRRELFGPSVGSGVEETEKEVRMVFPGGNGERSRREGDGGTRDSR